MELMTKVDLKLKSLPMGFSSSAGSGVFIKLLKLLINKNPRK